MLQRSLVLVAILAVGFTLSACKEKPKPEDAYIAFCKKQPAWPNMTEAKHLQFCTCVGTVALGKITDLEARAAFADMLSKFSPDVKENMFSMLVPLLQKMKNDPARIASVTASVGDYSEAVGNCAAKARE